MLPSWPHTYASLPEDMEAEQLAVSIIGTGPFGRGLAERLAEGGAKVWLGTREPANLRCEVPGAVTVVSYFRFKKFFVVLIFDTGEHKRGITAGQGCGSGDPWSIPEKPSAFRAKARHRRCRLQQPTKQGSGGKTHLCGGTKSSPASWSFPCQGVQHAGGV